MIRVPTIPFLVMAVLVLGACGGKEKAGPDTTQQPAAPAAEPASNMGENLTPDPGGKVITVYMLTDEQGNNRFEPNKLEAHQGDVLRYTLKVGVHNVHFLPDSNTIKTGLPPASPLLQLPGQTIDIKVTMPEGDYYFQCDPHALLGMKGRLKVEKKEQQ